jgi:hypothetical protein
VKQKPLKKKKLLDYWRKARSKDGPTGLALLAEVLNWNPAQMNISQFRKMDSRHEIIRQLMLEVELRNKDYGEQNDWREKLLSLQKELRSDIIGILEPVQLSAEEFRYWRSNEPRNSPPVDENYRPRLNRLGILTTKLKMFGWTEDLTPDPLMMLDVLLPGRTGPSSGRAWNRFHGELNHSRGTFEIEGERLTVIGRPPRFRDVRETLYFIIKVALQGESGPGFASLCVCSVCTCRKFFVRKRITRKHCSSRCRSGASNKRRTDNKSFHTRYETNRDDALRRAKNKFSAIVYRQRNAKGLDVINSLISAAGDEVLNGDDPPTGALKLFKKFVEAEREKALERVT